MGMSSMFAGSAGAPGMPVAAPTSICLPAEVNRLNWLTRISAARLSASSGVTVPSVSISIVSLSKLVIWPTRVFSTV